MTTSSPRLPRRSLVFGLLALPWAAQSQTVYRCGPGGTSYQQQPCAEGRAVDVSDSRSPAQVAEARASWRDQERWAQRAAQERRADEAANPPALAGGIAPAPKPPAGRPARADGKPPKAPKPRRAPTPREGEFVAFAPGRNKKRPASR